MKRLFVFLPAVGMFLLFCNTAYAIDLESGAFKDKDPMPVKYTKFGEDVSPPLKWYGVPDSARSFAIIADDPDAPVGVWVHWLIYNIPTQPRNLGEGVLKSPELANGIKQGVNSFGHIGYGGPAPPPGRPHRYLFTIYALDKDLQLPSGLTKQELLKMIEGHVVDKGAIIGMFGRGMLEKK